MAPRNKSPRVWVWGGGVPSQLGWGLGKGCAPTQEMFLQFTLNVLIFAEFCEEYDS